MKCPKCKNTEMDKIMEEAIASWWRCKRCGFELVEPEDPELRGKYHRAL